jgi:hypothetical protein
MLKNVCHIVGLESLKCLHRKRQQVTATLFIVLPLEKSLQIPKHELDGVEKWAIGRQKNWHDANASQEVNDFRVSVNGCAIEYPHRVRAWVLPDVIAFCVREVLAAFHKFNTIERALRIEAINKTTYPNKC